MSMVAERERAGAFRAAVRTHEIIPMDMTAESTERLLRFLGEGSTPCATSDLHIHTTISDGSMAFKEVCVQAAQRGLAHIAFTNHDTTVGLDYAIDTAASFGLVALGGIEISARDSERNRKVHVLGYGLKSASPALRSLCKAQLDLRTENTRWQMGRLIEAGYAVDVERAADFSQYSTAFYKQHLMAALTEEPYASSAYTELYQRLFKGDGICVRDITYVDARDAVRAIIADGGVAVLAHPGQLDSYDIVPDLVDCGLKGIERFHPDHGPADWERCAELEKRFDLFHTGGSDFHGTFGKIPHVGFYRSMSAEK